MKIIYIIIITLNIIISAIIFDAWNKQWIYDISLSIIHVLFVVLWNNLSIFELEAFLRYYRLKNRADTKSAGVRDRVGVTRIENHKGTAF